MDISKQLKKELANLEPGENDEDMGALVRSERTSCPMQSTAGLYGIRESMGF